MSYPDAPDLEELSREIKLYSQLKHEYGSNGIQPVINQAEQDLKAAIRKLKALPVDQKLAAAEPDALKAIQALRPKGPRRMWDTFKTAEFKERLEGALLARMAGCTLGAPVEFWSIGKMQRLAKELNSPFPPKDDIRSDPWGTWRRAIRNVPPTWPTVMPISVTVARVSMARCTSLPPLQRRLRWMIPLRH